MKPKAYKIFFSTVLLLAGNFAGISNAAVSDSITYYVTVSSPPAAVTDLAAATGSSEGEIDLSWTSPGDDGWSGNLTGKFRIDYATWTKLWTYTDYQVEISTSDCPPGANQGYTVTGLTAGATYYFRLWSADEVPNWSTLSNGATAWAQLSPPLTGVTIYPAYNGSFYGYEEGPHPYIPKSTATYNEIRFSSQALVMVDTQGTETQNSTCSVVFAGQYDCFGIFVSQPLAGNQIIYSTTTWTFHGGFAVQNAGTAGNPIIGHKTNAFIYLWRKDWLNTQALQTSPRADEWIILNNPESSERTANKGATTDWEDDIVSRSGLIDGINGNLTVNRGDRIVLEVQNHATMADTSLGKFYFRYYNSAAGPPYASSYLNADSSLEFAPYIYKFTDTGGNEITETLGSTAENPLFRRIQGGMFKSSNTISEIRFDGWSAIASNDSSKVNIWNNSLIEFKVPDVTGTVNVSVYVSDAATTTQQGSLKILPQISTASTSGPYAQGCDTFTYTINGHGLQSGCTITFMHGNVAVSDYNYSLIPGTVSCVVDIGIDASTGTYKVKVTNPDGGESPVSRQVDFTISLEETAPGKVTGFAAATGAQVSLSWVAPGDDNYSGDVSSGVFRINYSSDTFADAYTAENFVIIPGGYTQGSVYSRVITGLKPRTTYYFWIQARDDSDNWSVWSDTESIIPGTFILSQELTGISSSQLAWGDYDGDGDLDLAAVGLSGGGRFSKIYRNDNGTLTPLQNLVDMDSGNLAWGDYDNDGDLDIAIAGFSNGGEISKIYRNNSGTFSEDTSQSLTAVSKPSLAWGDYDNDGDLDLALSGDTNNAPGAGKITKIYRNDNGVLTEDTSQSIVGVYIGAVVWGDYDNDGDLDLLVTGEDSSQAVKTKLYRNDNGVLTEDTGQSLTIAENSSAAWGDYDNDGDLDLVVSGWGGGYYTKIYRNDGGTLTEVQSLTGLDKGSVSWGDYDNDGDLDLLVVGETSSTKEAKIYRNDAGTFTEDTNQNIVKVYQGIAKWGDFDGDGDLDFAVAGLKSDVVTQVFYIYKSMEADFGNPNTAPIAPGAGLTANYTNDRLELRWDKGTDTEIGDTKGLYYDVRVATKTISDNLEKWIVSPSTGAGVPNLGNYPHGFCVAASTQAGLNLSNGLIEGSTYYFEVRTIDTGLKKSTWALGVSKLVPNLPPTVPVLSSPSDNFTTNQMTIAFDWQDSTDAVSGVSNYNLQVSTDVSFNSVNYSSSPVASQASFTVSENKYYWHVRAKDNAGNYSVWTDTRSLTVNVPPGKVTGVAAATGVQVSLSWVAPGDDNYSGDVSSGVFRINYSSDTNADAYIAENFVIIPGSYTQGNTYSRVITGLKPRTTYYFWIQARDDNDNWSVWSDTGTAASGSLILGVEPLGANAGVWESSIEWGDYDNDGDLDLAVSGYDGGAYRLIIYRNDGGGTFTNVSEPLGANVGVYYSSIRWGDYDNDGDLDLAVSGYDGSNRRLIIYRNDGGGTFTNVLEPLGANAGVQNSSIEWGDYDNDGDLDLAVSGDDGGAYRLIIYRNDGVGTFTNAAEPMGANAGVYNSSIKWGDYDNDGDLDLAVSGYDSSLNTRLIIYRNDGGGTFTNAAEPFGPNSGVDGSSIEWGDYDNDGDLDLAVSGNDGGAYRLIIYRNDGGGTFTDVAEPMGANAGVYNSSIKWGDYDNDGDLDLAVSGSDGSNRRLIIYRNDGAGTFTNVLEPLGANAGVYYSSIRWGDYDNDGDLDLAVSGDDGSNKRLIIYKSLEADFGNPNTAPIAPGAGLTANYTNDRLELRWDKGTDTEIGDTKGLYYDVRVATKTISDNLEKWIVSPSTGAGVPNMGNYSHGFVVAASTQAGLNLSNSLIEGSTYYFEVRTIDTGLKKSTWALGVSKLVPNIPPTVPVLMAPLDNFTTNQLTVAFDWGDSTDAVSGVSNYDLEVSTKSDFSIVNYSSSPVVSQAFLTVSDGVYYWQVRAKDNAGNYSNWSSTRSIMVDATSPGITNNQPGDNVIRNSSGTVYDVDFTDAVSGLDTIQYKVTSLPAEAGTLVVDWTNIALLGGATSYTTNWPVDFNSLLSLSATNYVSVRAWDVAGATATTDDVFYILKDTAPPVVGLTAPATGYLNSLSQVEGTCYDSVEVSTVSIKVWDRKLNQYWNNTSVMWLVTEQWNAVDNLWTSSWTYTSVPSWVDGSSYTVIAKAQDTAGNWSTVYSTVTFTYDSLEPNSNISEPVSGNLYSSLTNISGTSWDTFVGDYSGVNKVEISIRDLTRGATYWNGSAWQNSVSWQVASGSKPYSYGFSDSSWTAGHEYQIRSRATDNAGNIETSVAVSSFTFDNQVPTVGVTQPTDNSYLNSLSQIDGTAADNIKVSTVSVKLWRRSFNDYWDSGSSNWLVAERWNTADNLWTSSWTYNSSFLLTNGSSYTVVAKSQDTTGNWSMVYSTITFTYDATSPISTVTYPVESGQYVDVNSIIGTSEDAISGVNNVEISLMAQDYPTPGVNYYWDGSTWTSAGGDLWLGATNTTTWSYDTTAINWTTGTYTVKSKAQDIAGNWEAPVSLVTFEIIFGTPAAPSGFAGMAESVSSIKWSWSNVANEDGYKVKTDTGGVLVDLSADSTYYIETGLSANTSYQRYVEAYNVSGSSASVPDTKYTNIETPAGISFGTVGATSIQAASQNTPSNLTSGNSGLIIENVTNGTTSSWKQDNAYWTSSALTPNTTYSFKAKARNGDGVETAYCSNLATVTLCNLPVAQSISNVTASSIRANWGANSNPGWTEYTVEMSSISSGGPVAASSVTLNAYSDFSGLDANTNYYFQVKAVNSNNIETAFTDLGSTHTLCNAPSSLAFTAVNQTQIDLSWQNNGNTGSTVYELEASTGTNAAYGIIYNGAGLSYSHTGLTANVTYYYKVRAKNLDGVYSAYAAAIDTHTLCAAPGNISFTAAAESQIDLTWVTSGNSGSTIYTLEASSGTNSNYLVVYNGSSASYSHTALSANVTYYYKVKAKNLDNTETAYNTPAGTHTLCSPPVSMIITGLTATQIDVAWGSNGNSGSTIYELESSTMTDTAYGIIYSGTGLSYSHTLTPNATHYYKVRAKNLDGVNSSYSAVVDSATLANPPTGSYVSAVSSVSITINWTLNGNPSYTRWGIVRSTDNFVTSTATLKQFSDNYTGTSYIDGSVIASTTYWYKVQAYNEDGIATAYDTTISTVTNAGPPAAPSGFAGMAESVSSIKWSWSNVANEDGYKVRNDIGGLVADLIADSTYYIETGLSANTSYQRYVEAYNVSGSSASAPDTKYTWAYIPAGSSFSAVYKTSVTVTWTANSNPAGTEYKVECDSTSPYDFASVDLISSWATANTYTFTGLTNDTSYYFRVKARNGNVIETGYDSIISTVTVYDDKVVPTSGITTPADGTYQSSVPQIRGTCADDVAVSTAAIRIYNQINANYWNSGSSIWDATLTPETAWFAPELSSGGTFWWYNAPAWSDTKIYEINAKVMDTSSNWSTAFSTAVFTYDVTEPASSVDSPLNGNKLATLTNLNGTATDATSGISQVKLQIMDLTNGATYWNGGGWVGTPAWLTTTWGAPNWSYSFVDGDWTEGHVYEIKSQAADTAGNTESTVAQSTFTFSKAGVKLQVILPGETSVPGAAPGKSGTPSAQTAGVAFSVTVNAGDDLWNFASNAVVTAQLATSDPNDTEPASISLTGGTTVFAVTMVTAGTATITASDTDGTPLLSDISSGVTINPNLASKLQVLAPGESADPGSAGGKTGTPVMQAAGGTFTVTVNACDDYWNVVSSTATVNVTTSDSADIDPGNIVLAAGTQNAAVTLVTVSTAVTITATSAGYASDTSAYITVSSTDTVSPTAGIIEPSVVYINSLAKIAGTASDNVAVSSVSLWIERKSDSSVWDGASWTGAGLWISADNVYVSSWSYTTAVSWSDGNNYDIIVKAKDSNDNWSTVYDTATFTYDVSLPTSAVTFPVEGGQYSDVTSITGTSTDTVSGIAGVKIKLKDTAAVKYWTGSSWTATEIWNVCLGSTSWNYSSVPLWSTGTYTAWSKAQDLADNFGTGLSSVTFTIIFSTPAAPASFAGKAVSASEINWSWSDLINNRVYTGNSSSGLQEKKWNGTTWDTYSKALASVGPGDGIAIGDGRNDGVIRIYAGAGMGGTNEYTWTGSSWTETYTFSGQSASDLAIGQGKNDGINRVYIALGNNGIEEYTYSGGNWVNTDSVGIGDGVAVGMGRNEHNNESFYRLKRNSDDLNLSGDLIADTTFYIETGLAVNTSYQRYVEAYNISGSASSAADIRYTFANAPSGSYVSAVSSVSVTLNWNANGNPSGTEYYAEYDTTTLFTSPDGNSGWITSTQASFNTLAASTTYYFRVKSRNGNSMETAYDSAVTTMTEPGTLAAPASFAGMAVSTSEINWSWADVAGEAGYRVKTDTGGVLADLAADTTFWVETGLSVNTSYQRYVEACNVSGSSASATKIRYTLANIPSSLSVFAVSSTTVSIQWGFNGSPAGTRFGVAKSTDNFTINISTVANFSNVLTNNYLDVINLEPGTTYYLRVWAYNGDGLDTAWTSSVSTVTVQAVSATPAPSGFAGIALSDSSIEWSWADNAVDEDAYYIKDSSGVVISLPADTTSYTETSLSANNPYYRYVEVHNAAGSAASAPVMIYTLTRAPANFAVNSVSTSAIKVSWSANGNPEWTYYDIDWSTSSGFNSYYTDTSTGTSYNIAGPLTADVTYFIRITAEGDNYLTAYSTVTTNTGSSAPLAPSSFAGAAQGTDSILWTWSDNANNEDKYVILSDTTGVMTELPANSTYWLETGLLPNTAYSRYAQAYRASGNSDSSVDSAYTFAEAPSSLAASLTTGTTVQLSWTAGAGGAAVYGIERSTDGGSTWVTLKDFIDAYADTSYSDTGLNSDSTYYYKVAAFNHNGVMTSFAGPIAARTADITSPSAVMNLAAKTLDLKGAVSLSWTNPGDDGTAGVIIGGSQIIKYATGGNTVTAPPIVKDIIPGTTESITLTGLNAGAVYNFYVSVKDEAGNASNEVSVSTSAGAQPVLLAYGITSPITAGVASDITVEAKNALSVRDTDYAGTITFASKILDGTYTGADAASVLPSDYTFTTSDAGAHTFSSAVKFLDKSEVYSCYVSATDKSDPLITGKQTVLVSPPTYISGSVTQKDGTPITGVYVEAYGVGLDTGIPYTTVGGSYTIVGLEVGTYTVRVTWTGNDGLESSAEKQTANGTAGFDFTLEVTFDLSVIQGSIAGLNPARASAGIRAARGIMPSSVPDYAFVELSSGKKIMKFAVKPDGSFKIGNLIPGRYSIRAWDGERFSNAQSVNITGGQMESVKFTFPVSAHVYCWPNPFNEEKTNETGVHISYIGQNYERTVRIYTITGELVRDSGDFASFIRAEDGKPGYEFIWNLRNNSRQDVASGVYFYILDLRDGTTGEKKTYKGKIGLVR